MLTQNLITLITLALSVSGLPHYTPTPTSSPGLPLPSSGPGPDTVSPDLSLPSSGPDTVSPDLSLPSSGPGPSPDTVSPELPLSSSLPTAFIGSPGLPLSSSLPHGATIDKVISTPVSSLTTEPSSVPTSASSGEDGGGNQNVGNGGQNAWNDASNGGGVGGDYTVQQASQKCGGAQLNCCSKATKEGDTTNAGLLGAVFGSGDLGVQCTPINIPVIGFQVPMNKACDAKAACCRGDTTQNGVVNVGCIALASLI